MLVLSSTEGQLPLIQGPSMGSWEQSPHQDREADRRREGAEGELIAWPSLSQEEKEEVGEGEAALEMRMGCLVRMREVESLERRRGGSHFEEEEKARWVDQRTWHQFE